MTPSCKNSKSSGHSGNAHKKYKSKFSWLFRNKRVGLRPKNQKQMEVYSSIAALQQAVRAAKAAGKSVGLVPTMGALHNGHISLVKKCRAGNGMVVTSVFVNPTQFNDPRDLASYPRTLEADTKLLEAAGCDAVFAPSVEEMYPEKDTREFHFGELETVMEGVRRPGHFNGVAQIVTKLFDAVQPDRAYFGEKDFQQLAIIRRMVAQYNYPVEIVPCPIVREDDGLALSSRNMLLDSDHRAAAPLIYKTLKASVAMKNYRTVEAVKRWVVEEINHSPLLEVEYYEIVGADDLQPVSDWQNGRPLQGCITVHAGAVRLIDNIAY